MKNKIINVLANHPNGLRLRDLATECKVHTLYLWNPISQLIAENKITEIAVNSFLTGESYYIFKLIKEITK